MRKKERKKEFDTFQKSIDPRETLFLEGTIAAKPTHACNASPVQGTNELALFKTEMWVRCPPFHPPAPSCRAKKKPKRQQGGSREEEEKKKKEGRRSARANRDEPVIYFQPEASKSSRAQDGPPAAKERWTRVVALAREIDK